MMDGQVPWRCLVPADAVSFLIGKGGTNIRQLSESSGAQVAVSKDGETPATLADKIVTIGGLVDQKENACGQVVKKLRQMQGVNDHEPAVFVIIVPQISAPVIIGAKGAQIKSIMEMSGAEINVGREAIIGMPDQPISINGTLEQVVSAVSKLNGVLQDMADRGKLADRDFVFRGDAPADLQHGGAEATPNLQREAPMSHETHEAREAPYTPAPSPSPPFGGSGNSCGGGNPASGMGGGLAGSSSFGNSGGGNQQQQASFGSAGNSHGSTTNGGVGGCSGGPTSFGGAGGCSGGPTSFGGGCGGGCAGCSSGSFGGCGACSSSGGGGSSFGGCGGGSGGGGCGGGSGGGGAGEAFASSALGPGSMNGMNCGGGPSSAASDSGSNAGGFGQSSGIGGQTSFGPGGPSGGSSFGACGSSFGPGGQQTSFGGPNGQQQTSFGQNGGMGGCMGGMGGMGMGGMGMGNPMMGGMGMGNMMGMGMGNPMMGGMASQNERAFMAALQASGINSAQLTLLMPQGLLQNVLIPRGIMAEIAQRSGAKIDLGAESPAGMRQVALTGTMVANSLASLFLQEKVIQFQQMGQQMG
mmetsp:Transcript_73665/g.185689  ORF Transcript_73665/g.185689 Transcript_73665/m.185689 type:complete len:583 (-) Transcript_73665:144-1892(-)